MKWEAGIPGKEGTDWAGGVFKITMEFPEEVSTLSQLVYFQFFYHHDIAFSILQNLQNVNLSRLFFIRTWCVFSHAVVFCFLYCVAVAVVVLVVADAAVAVVSIIIAIILEVAGVRSRLL